MTDDYLKGWVDRVERVETEQKELGTSKSDLFTEAKGKGYNAKALRRLIRERKQKDADEIEAELERYRSALGMPGATYRSVADQLGVPKSTLQRRVPRKKNGTSATPGHDPETGEIPAAGVPAAPESCGSAEGRAQPAMRGAEQSAEEGCSAASAVSPQAGVESGPQDLDLTIPQFLRAVR